MFRQAMQKEGESLDDYAVRLRSIAKDCDFENPDEQLRQLVLVGSRMNSVRGKMVTEPCTLEQLLSFGKSVEAGEMMREALAVANGGVRVVVLRKVGDNGAGDGRRPSEKRCFDCGLEYSHKCKKVGHFAKCCRTKVVRWVALDSEEESEQEAQGSLVGSVRSKAFQIASEHNNPQHIKNFFLHFLTSFNLLANYFLLMIFSYLLIQGVQ
jgi:hypothetical protein